MARPDTPILNRLAEVNDGRSALSGESSGQGFLGGLGGYPVVSRHLPHELLDRLPEKDTKNSYAFRTGAASYKLIVKTVVDGK